MREPTMNFNLNTEGFNKELRRSRIYDLVNKLALAYYEQSGKSPDLLVCSESVKIRFWREELVSYRYEDKDVVMYIATAVGELLIKVRRDLQPGTMYVEKSEPDTKWIPGDSPTEDHGWFLVTVENVEGLRVVFRACFNRGCKDLWQHHPGSGSFVSDDYRVIAHFPFPEPYSG